jgi:hypothetical protein
MIGTVGSARCRTSQRGETTFVGQPAFLSSVRIQSALAVFSANPSDCRRSRSCPMGADNATGDVPRGQFVMEVV